MTGDQGLEVQKDFPLFQKIVRDIGYEGLY